MSDSKAIRTNILSSASVFVFALPISVQCSRFFLLALVPSSAKPSSSMIH